MANGAWWWKGKKRVVVGRCVGVGEVESGRMKRRKKEMSVNEIAVLNFVKL